MHPGTHTTSLRAWVLDARGIGVHGIPCCLRPSWARRHYFSKTNKQTNKHKFNISLCSGSFCVNLTQLELSQRKELPLRKCLHEIQLVIKGERPLVGGTISGLVGSLGSIREQAEQARGGKPVEKIPPWPLHQFLLSDLLEFQP